MDIKPSFSLLLSFKLSFLLNTHFKDEEKSLEITLYRQTWVFLNPNTHMIKEIIYNNHRETSMIINKLDTHSHCS